MKFTDRLRKLESDGYPIFLSTEFLRNHAKEILALVDAAEKGADAMNVWVNTYAPELCDKDEVAKARKIISDGGGTLAYIADVNEQLCKALAALEKEQS